MMTNSEKKGKELASLYTFRIGKHLVENSQYKAHGGVLRSSRAADDNSFAHGATQQ